MKNIKKTLEQIHLDLQTLEPDDYGYIKESFLENEVAKWFKNL